MHFILGNKLLFAGHAVLRKAFSLVVPRRVVPFPLAFTVTPAELLCASGGLPTSHGRALVVPGQVADGDGSSDIGGGAVGGAMARLAALMIHVAGW